MNSLKNALKKAACVVAAVAMIQVGPEAAAQQIPKLDIPSSSDLGIKPPKLPNVNLPNVDIPGSSRDVKAKAQAVAPRINNAKPAPMIRNGGDGVVFTHSTGRVRRYLINIPTGYNPARPAPVVFGFDGWRDSPENFRRYSRLNETGAAHEAIRIYPESINRGWEGAPYAIVRPGEDLAFIQQIIDEVDRTYNVDRTRIYATGHSNGGGMTAVVACHLPHVFAGAAAVGGAFYDPVNMNCNNDAIPFLVMHGTGDTMMQYYGGYRHNGAHYLAIDDLMGSYIRRNGCAFPPRIDPIPGGHRHVYNCSRAETQLITNPQNHTWNRIPDASQEVWNFLSRQRL